MPAVCSVAGCESCHRVVRGLCNRHYLRLRRHGDASWTPVRPTGYKWKKPKVPGRYTAVCRDGRSTCEHRVSVAARNHSQRFT